MVRATQRYLILAVMGTSLITIVVMGLVFHIGLLFVLVAALSVLLVIGYAWKRSRPSEPKPKIFWAVLEASLIFFAGAIYGVVESLRDGWHWTYLLFLIVPIAMGSYLLWFALRIRRKTAA